MNGIMGMAKLLADTKLSAEQRTYVGAVSTSASALLALIEDLLDYSKIEAGRFELEPQPVSVREIADNIVELLAARAYAKGIGIGCHVAPDVPHDHHRRSGSRAAGAAQSDRQRHQVHGQRRCAGRSDDRPARAPRRPSVSRSATPAQASRRTMSSRIFEEFEQADGTSTRKHGGAGLGLAISKRIVTSMGGSIGVTSELGMRLEIPFRNPGKRRQACRRQRACTCRPPRRDLFEERRRGGGDRPHRHRQWRHRPTSSLPSPRPRSMPTAATRCWSTPRWKRRRAGCSSACGKPVSSASRRSR